VDSVSIGRLEVESVVKGETEAAQTVYWWYPAARPEGWTGHQGQAPTPPRGERITVYADAHGELLVPNGWEPAPPVSAGSADDAAADDDDDEPATDDDAATVQPGPAAAEPQEETPAETNEPAARDAAPAGDVVERKEHPIRALFRSIFKVLGTPFALVSKLFKKK